MRKFQTKDGLTLEIREAEPRDAKNILEYLDLVSGESQNITFGPGEFDKSVKAEKKFLENVKKASNSIFVLAMHGDEIAGQANIGASPRPRIRHLGELGITVRKKYWRKGVGRAIMTYLVDWAVSAGLRKINLEVRTDNYGAIKLYEDIGFVREGTRSRSMYIDGAFVSTYTMGLEIDT